MGRRGTLEERAARHAALGDAARLAIVDELCASDRAPIELRRRLGMESNLLAHHLDVLDGAGLIQRWPSSGDRRRRYVHLVRDSLEGVMAVHRARPSRALFVCRANSARSQMAAALWRQIAGEPADAAGTHPADRVDAGAVAAAGRVGLDLGLATPRRLDDVDAAPRLKVTVCDQAHEEVGDIDTWLHWSVPDPVPEGTEAAFDAALADIRDRICLLLGKRGSADGGASATKDLAPPGSMRHG